MIEKDFDSLLRQKLCDCEADPPGPEVWTGIEAALGRKQRLRTIWRPVAAALAVAASVAAVLVLSPAGGEDTPVSGQSMIAAANSADVVEVAEAVQGSIGDQIKDLAATLASGNAAVSGTASGNVAANGNASGNTSGAVSASGTASGNADGAASGDASGNAALPGNTDDAKTASGEAQVHPDILNTVDWNAILKEEGAATNGGSPVLALLSNVTSVSSGEFTPSGTSHMAPSKSGDAAGSHIPQAVSEPRYFMPLSFGLQFKMPVTKRISLGIGANYTYIVSKYDALVNGIFRNDVYNQLHYVGVPVQAYFEAVGSNNFGAYLTAGASIEKCLRSRYVYGSETVLQDVDGFQFSAMAGIGMEYWMAPSFGLYLDPSLVYYFSSPDSRQPLSIRTAEPLQIRFEAGLRFKL